MPENGVQCRSADGDGGGRNVRGSICPDPVLLIPAVSHCQARIMYVVRFQILRQLEGGENIAVDGCQDR